MKEKKGRKEKAEGQDYTYIGPRGRTVIDYIVINENEN